MSNKIKIVTILIVFASIGIGVLFLTSKDESPKPTVVQNIEFDNVENPKSINSHKEESKKESVLASNEFEDLEMSKIEVENRLKNINDRSMTVNLSELYQIDEKMDQFYRYFIFGYDDDRNELSQESLDDLEYSFYKEVYMLNPLVHRLKGDVEYISRFYKRDDERTIVAKMEISKLLDIIVKSMTIDNLLMSPHKKKIMDIGKIALNKDKISSEDKNLIDSLKSSNPNIDMIGLRWLAFYAPQLPENTPNVFISTGKVQELHKSILTYEYKKNALNVIDEIVEKHKLKNK